MMSEDCRVWIGRYGSSSTDGSEGTERERMGLGSGYRNMSFVCKVSYLLMERWSSDPGLGNSSTKALRQITGMWLMQWVPGREESVQGRLEPGKLEETRRVSRPEPLEGVQLDSSLTSAFWPPRLRQNTLLLINAIQFVAICYGSLGKWIQVHNHFSIFFNCSHNYQMEVLDFIATRVIDELYVYSSPVKQVVLIVHKWGKCFLSILFVYVFPWWTYLSKSKQK